MNENIERIRPNRIGFKVGMGVLALFVIIVLASSLVITHENEYMLINQFGSIDRVIDRPGLSLKIPFVETASTLNKEILYFDLAPSDVITGDKKAMVADCYVLWRIVDPMAFVKTLNSRINAESRINTTVYNSIKNVISSLDQAEIISGRDGALNSAIMANLGDVMEQYGIHILSVETKHLDLPNDNKLAVYERMISERNNIAATYTAEGEAEATKIHTTTDNEIAIRISKAQADAEKIIAEGEAEYMKILSDAYKDTSRSDFYTFVRSLDALKVAMTGKDKTVILSSDSPIAQIFDRIE